MLSIEKSTPVNGSFTKSQTECNVCFKKRSSTLLPFVPVFFETDVSSESQNSNILQYLEPLIRSLQMMWLLKAVIIFQKSNWKQP